MQSLILGSIAVHLWVAVRALRLARVAEDRRWPWLALALCAALILVGRVSALTATGGAAPVALQALLGEFACIGLAVLALHGTQRAGLALEEVRRARIAERALRDRDQVFETLVDTLPHALMTYAADGRIDRANTACETVFGHPADRLRGRDIRELFSGERIESTLFSPSGPGSAERRVECRTADGDRLPVILWTGALQTGADARFFVVAHDLSARESLERQVLRSQRMEAVGQLASGIVHDFNNILTAILGFGELLGVQLEDGHPARESAHQIQDAARRAADLNRKLLAFCREEARKTETVDLDMVIEDLEPMLGQLIGDGVRLICESHDNMARVRSSSDDIQQIILNLVINARDAMPKGGTLRVETDVVDLAPEAAQHDLEPGPHVRLVVTDTGVGMNEEVRDRAFDPFFTTKARGEGTGLGLSTVYGLVEQSGGWINIDSRVGEGTRVEILLPQDADPQVLVPLSAPAVPQSRQAKKRCVLLAEDDPTVRAIISTALLADGFEVLTAENGPVALSMYSRMPEVIDLLVSDVRMPGMGGPELLSGIRASGYRGPALFVSGYLDVGEGEQSLGDGERLLRKPFTPSQLLEEVYCALEDAGPLAAGVQDAASTSARTVR